MSVGTVAFLPLNSCSLQRVLPLCILMLFIPVQRGCNFDVRLVRFRVRAYY